MGIVLEENESQATFPNDEINFKGGFAEGIGINKVDKLGKRFIKSKGTSFKVPRTKINTPKSRKLELPKGTSFKFGGFQSDVISTGQKTLRSSRLPKTKQRKLPKIRRQKLPSFTGEPDVLRLGSNYLGRTRRR